jgi:hypothetical protein
MKPIKLTDAQMDSALGLPGKLTCASSHGEWRTWLDKEIRESKATGDAERYNRAWSRFLLKAPKPAPASRDNGYDTGHQSCDGQGCPACCPDDTKPDEQKPELTHVEKTLLGALK